MCYSSVQLLQYKVQASNTHQNSHHCANRTLTWHVREPYSGLYTYLNLKLQQASRPWAVLSWGTDLLLELFHSIQNHSMGSHRSAVLSGSQTQVTVTQ